MSKYAKLIRRAAIGSPILITSGYGFYYRPDPNAPELINKQLWISRKLKSSYDLADMADKEDPWPIKFARFVVIGGVAIFSKALLFGLNDTKLKRDEHYTHLVHLLKYRPPGLPLLTVSNHCSTLDDPAVLGALVPLSVDLTPKQMRWTLCSQEICFMNAFTSSFFGVGKVMPIERGGGIDQELLIKFARRLTAGDWCHIFPEGRTVQTGKLGGRMIGPGHTGVVPGVPEGSKFPTLKWGVGKLIAHSPVMPVIVPMHHTGMQDIIPEHPVTRDVLLGAPMTGHLVSIRVGAPISVQDLVDAYEAVNGPLKKFVANAGLESPRDKWISTAKERELYAAITMRIQIALESLEAEAYAELGPTYPGKPKVILNGDWERLASSEGKKRKDAERAERPVAA